MAGNTIQADSLADLVAGTLRDLGRFKWTDIMTATQDHVAWNRLMQEKKIKFDDGYGIQFNVQYQTSGAARHLGLFEVDDVDVADTMVQGNIPWRHGETKMAIEKREISMNRGKSRIFDLIKTRQADAMTDWAETFEDAFWVKPSSSSDLTQPFGVTYWIVYNATAGFNGGNPSGFTSGAAGLDVATYTRWKNYSVNYTTVSKTDLVRKIRKAATFTRFRSPIRTNIQPYDTGTNFGYYTNYNVIGTLEELLEDQNENLGNDVASKDGDVMFRRNPVVWVPNLEDRTGDPVFGINWGVFKPVFLRGEFMRQSGPNNTSGAQRNVIKTFWDTSYNNVCYDRRKCFVAATADPG